MFLLGAQMVCIIAAFFFALDAWTGAARNLQQHRVVASRPATQTAFQRSGLVVRAFDSPQVETIPPPHRSDDLPGLRSLSFSAWLASSLSIVSITGLIAMATTNLLKGRQGRRRLRLRAATDSSSSPLLPSSAVAQPHAVILPGFLAGASKYEGFAATLANRGRFASVDILPIQQLQWIPTLFGASFRFYLEALEAALTRPDGSRPVVLVGHSAGGWLARLYLGLSREGRVYDGRAYTPPSPQILTLVTLGTPHYSTEKYPFGRFSERRRGEDPSLPPHVAASSLQLTNFLYDDPAALGCEVVSVCGVGVLGEEGNDAGMAYTFNGCDAKSLGDGVTPLPIAVARGSRDVVQVDCTHGAGQPKWYGSEEGVDQWLHHI